MPPPRNREEHEDEHAPHPNRPRRHSVSVAHLMHGEYLLGFSCSSAQSLQATIIIMLKIKEQGPHTPRLPPHQHPASPIVFRASLCQDTITCVPISPHARLLRLLAPILPQVGTTITATKVSTSVLRS